MKNIEMCYRIKNSLVLIYNRGWSFSERLMGYAANFKKRDVATTLIDRS